jgi:hypothetical protein
MPTESPPLGRAVLLASVVMTGVALSPHATLPTWRVEFDVLGSPLGIGVGGGSLLLGFLVLLTATGVDALVRTVPELRTVPLRYTVTTWFLPCLVTIAAAAAAPVQVAYPAQWLLGLLVMGGLLLLIVLATLGTVHTASRYHRVARLGLNVGTFVAAFALYFGIYGLQVRSLLSATAVMLVTFPLALELMRGTAEQLGTTWLYAAVVAVVTGQLTWALNAWGLSPSAGGAVLLLAFYTFGGISQQHLARRLNRRVVLEYVLTAVFGLAVIWVSSPWLMGGGTTAPPAP